MYVSGCSGVVVKRARKGCELESCMCQNKNTIGEEDNGKPSHKIHFPSKTQNTVSGLHQA